MTICATRCLRGKWHVTWATSIIKSLLFPMRSSSCTISSFHWSRPITRAPPSAQFKYQRFASTAAMDYSFAWSAFMVRKTTIRKILNELFKIAATFPRLAFTISKSGETFDIPTLSDYTRSSQRKLLGISPLSLYMISTRALIRWWMSKFLLSLIVNIFAELKFNNNHNLLDYSACPHGATNPIAKRKWSPNRSCGRILSSWPRH